MFIRFILYYVMCTLDIWMIFVGSEIIDWTICVYISLMVLRSFFFWSLQWNWGQLTLRLTNWLKFVLFLFYMLLVLYDYVLRDNFLCFLQSWNEYFFFFYFFVASWKLMLTSIILIYWCLLKNFVILWIWNFHTFLNN